MTFEAFPKIPRLKRDCVVTEKLDGTNASVIIERDFYEPEKCMRIDPVAVVDGLAIFAGSRSRLIYPGKTTDNFGFAAWVKDNAAELVKLGLGRHFGEWYGKGIQRGYGLPEKRFALFNTSHWTDNPERPACCSVVPVLYRGLFDTSAIENTLRTLEACGSAAVPGFMNPEGIIIYHGASRMLFKRTFDDGHKEAA